MSDHQKNKNGQLLMSQGAYPPSAIARSSEAIFERLRHRAQKAKQSLSLLTDEHYQYARALRRLQGIEHVTVSSKKARTFRNILFPVNHADLLTRQYIKAFARETISFSKKPSAMVQKYALFCIWKNYMRPQFTKAHKEDPGSNLITPAQSAGITQRKLTFGDFFQSRITDSKMKTQNPDWNLFIQDQVPYPRRKPRVPAFTPQLTTHS
jgi:hypothetical protein